jgi:hypothetical protein
MLNASSRADKHLSRRVLSVLALRCSAKVLGALLLGTSPAGSAWRGGVGEGDGETSAAARVVPGGEGGGGALLRDGLGLSAAGDVAAAVPAGPFFAAGTALAAEEAGGAAAFVVVAGWFSCDISAGLQDGGAAVAQEPCAACCAVEATSGCSASGDRSELDSVNGPVHST